MATSWAGFRIGSQHVGVLVLGLLFQGGCRSAGFDGIRVQTETTVQGAGITYSCDVLRERGALWLRMSVTAECTTSVPVTVEVEVTGKKLVAYEQHPLELNRTTTLLGPLPVPGPAEGLVRTTVTAQCGNPSDRKVQGSARCSLPK
jgi:hypothetical protein